MVAESATIPSTGNSRLDWKLGVWAGLIAVATIFAWLYWGRALQFAVALSAAAFGLFYMRYIEVPIVLLGFLLTSNIANYIPGSTSVFMILTLLVLILRKLVAGELTWRLSPLVVTALVFIGYFQSTGLWVEHTTNYVWDLLYRVIPVLLVVSELMSTPRHHVWFFVGIAFGMLFTSVSTIKTAFEFYTMGVADSIAGSVTNIESTRFYGHWPDPNIMSMTLTAFLGGVIAYWRSNLHYMIRGLMVVTVVATVAAILMSLSRAGLVGVIIVVGMMLAVERRRWLLLTVVVAVTLLLLTVLPIDVFGRVASLLSGTDKSSSERFSLLAAGWQMFWDNPIFGGGLGHFQNNISFFVTYLRHAMFAHNSLVELAVDGGLVAVLLFVACIVIALKGLNWKNWKGDPTDKDSMLNAGLRAGLVASMFSMLTLTAYSFVPVWVLMTMCASYPGVARNRSLNESQTA